MLTVEKWEYGLTSESTPEMFSVTNQRAMRELSQILTQQKEKKNDSVTQLEQSKPYKTYQRNKN